MLNQDSSVADAMYDAESVDFGSLDELMKDALFVACGDDAQIDVGIRAHDSIVNDVAASAITFFRKPNRWRCYIDRVFSEIFFHLWFVTKKSMLLPVNAEKFWCSEMSEHFFLRNHHRRRKMTR